MGKSLKIPMHRSRQQQRGKQASGDRFHPSVAGFKTSAPPQAHSQNDMRGARRAAPAAAQEPSGEVEEEYIGNLQKQVYFLELESKLLREKLNDKPPDHLDAPGPLDDHLVKLKSKYAQLEGDMASKNLELQDTANELRQDLEESQQHRTQLQGHVDELEALVEQMRTQFAGGNEDLLKQMALLETRLAMTQNEAANSKAEVEIQCARVLDARVDREVAFNELNNKLQQCTLAKQFAEGDAARRLAEMKKQETDRMAADEELMLMQEQEEARKQTLKAMNDQKCDLELELRQVTAERDHAKAAITKLESDHRRACEDCNKAEKKVFELNRGVRDMKLQLEVAARTREEEAGFKTEQREKMLRAVAEHEVTLSEKNKLLSECDEVKHEKLVMLHEKKLWEEEKQLVRAEKERQGGQVNTAEENAQLLSTELKLIKERFEKRGEQVNVLRSELRKFKESKLRLEAQLATANDKLTLASELDSLKLEEFATMRATNLEVANKIERFMDATTKQSSKPKSTGVFLDDNDPLFHDDV